MCHSEICVQSGARVYGIKIVGYVIAIKNFPLLLPFSLPSFFLSLFLLSSLSSISKMKWRKTRTYIHVDKLSKLYNRSCSSLFLASLMLLIIYYKIIGRLH